MTKSVNGPPEVLKAAGRGCGESLARSADSGIQQYDGILFFSVRTR
jgi:hypothetical protein